MTREPVRTLWVCGSLPLLQRLALASFVAHGHPVELYTYDGVAGVPAGVSVLDAENVLDRRRVFRYGVSARSGRGSYAGFSNLFRYRLLAEQGGWWIDTDLVCLRPLPTTDLVIPTERSAAGRTVAASCALRMPGGSPLAAALYDAADRRGSRRLTWGETGPLLVAKQVRERRLTEHLSPPEAFCPVDWVDQARLFEPGFELPATSYAVHCWHELLRRRRSDPESRPHPQSPLGRLLERYDVPIQTRAR